MLNQTFLLSGVGLLQVVAAAAANSLGGSAPAFAVPTHFTPIAHSAVADPVVAASVALAEANASSGISASALVAAAAVVGLAAGVVRGSTAARGEAIAMAAHRKPTKKGRKFTIIECVEQRQMVKDGVPGAGGPRGGVSRYFTEKNVRNTPALLELRKFNKYLGRHTVHRELK
mmetsp:Transcript_74286/g.187164  ORF Transcript_74286/g.187164 Transcript_74286/m.187164 type:complete len:173 (-) Transcript_74286:64-582(-)